MHASIVANAGYNNGTVDGGTLEGNWLRKEEMKGGKEKNNLERIELFFLSMILFLHLSTLECHEN